MSSIDDDIIIIILLSLKMSLTTVAMSHCCWRTTVQCYRAVLH